MKRRQFLARAWSGVTVSTCACARVLRAQSAVSQPLPTGVMNMDGDWYRPVRQPSRPDAKRQVTDADVNRLERRLACPCPCPHDIFTCRSVDPGCTYAPRIHRDIEVLADGGYSADEIVAVMRATYGESILMTPGFRGLGVVAWLAPLAALAAGVSLLLDTMRSWQRANTTADSTVRADITATPREHARISADQRDSLH